MTLFGERLSDQEIINRLKNLFKTKPAPRFFSQIVFEFTELWNDEKIGWQAIINNIDIEKFLSVNTTFKSKLYTILKGNSFTLNEEISSKISSLPYYNSWYMESLQKYEPNEVFNQAVNLSNKLIEIYKNYLLDLINFYNNHTGFHYLFDFFYPEYLIKPFFKYFDKNRKILTYDKSRNNLLFMELINEIISNRYFDIPKYAYETIIEELSKIKKSEQKRLSNIANKIRYKVYTYRGFKCPEHIIYISYLENELANELSNYATEHFFEEGTDKFVLSLLFLGRNGIVSEEKYNPTNRFMSKPMIIKFKQLGYVAYIYHFLLKNGLIYKHNLWESIARHKCFKIRRQDGSANYITNFDLSNALKYKIKKIKSKEANEVREYKIDKLDRFLKKITEKNT